MNTVSTLKINNISGSSIATLTSTSDGNITFQGSQSGNGFPISGSGIAGTPDTGVITVQGITSGTALPISGSVSITGTQSVTITSGTTAVTQATAANLLSQVSQPTAANLNATVVGSGNFNILGTGVAGTPATGVVTVQGIASGTTIPVTAIISGTPAVTITSGTTVVTQSTAASLNATVIGTGTGSAVQVSQNTAANLNATVVGSVTATISGTPSINIVNGGSAGMLFPGTLTQNYIIASACTAKFTAGSRSYNATYTQCIMSIGGGNISVNWLDGSSDIFYLLAGLVYNIYITQINLTGTAVNDLQIWV